MSPTPVTRSLVRAVPFVLGLTLLADSAHAAWTRNGFPATTATGSQGFPQIVTDGAGGAYVGWRDPGSTAFRLTHLDVNGDVAAPWPAEGIVMASPSSSDSIFLGSDAAGGAMVGAFGLNDASAIHIKADTTTSPYPTTVVCGVQFMAGSAAEPGALFYSFLTGACGNTAFVVTDRFGPAGAREWDHEEAHSLFDFGTFFGANAVASDLGPGAYLVNRGDSASRVLFHVTRLDSTGQFAAGWGGTVGRALLATSSTVSRPILVPHPAGVVCLWIEAFGAGDRIMADWIAGDGTAAPAVALTDSLSQHNLPFAVRDDAGGVFVVWRNTAIAGSVFTLQGLHANASGVVDAGPAALVPSPRDQTPSSLVRDGHGGFIVAWVEDRLNDATPRVSVSRFDATLSLAPSWPAGGLLLCDAPGGQEQEALAMSDGNLLAAWRDRRGLSAAPATDEDIYVAKATPDGAVPALCSLVSVQAGPHQVHVRWQSDSGPASATVLRSTDGVEWSEHGTVLRGGTGSYDLVDGSVSPGSRVAYRLLTDTGKELASTVWVDVPAEPALALAGFVANAARPTIALVLASSDPARLEAFDVGGRRLASFDLSAPAPGERHEVVPVALRPGFYVMRLTQSGHTVTSRGILLE